MNPSVSSRPSWLHDPLLATLAQRATAWLAGRDLHLEDLCVGSPISWALVADGAGRRALGLALTPAVEGGDRSGLYAGLPADWREWPLAELPARVCADHPLERCLGLCVINAISQYRLGGENLTPVIADPDNPVGRGNVVDWVAAQRPERLVMIGNMVPVVEGLTAAGFPPKVFERNPGNRSGALNDAQEWAWLPRADGLIVTGATLVNHTLAPLVAWSREARFRVLVGFSAQAHPAFLAGLGLTHVFSLHIRNIDATRRRLQVGNWRSMFESEIGYFTPLE